MIDSSLKIMPSILSADFANMKDAVAPLEAWGAYGVHCDIMDGTFVPNLTFGAQMVRAVAQHTALPLDVHLMVEHPETYVQSFAQAGAAWITIHQESSRHLQRVLASIRAAGVKAGIALNPATPLCTIEDLLDDLDLVLLMCVNPGFGGQQLIPHSFDKIRRLKQMIGNRPIQIEVDGGVKCENAKEFARAGAEMLVAGSAIFENSHPDQAILKMKQADFCR